MFEGLASSLLSNILGDYIQDFDPKSLDIGIWSGAVDLKDLRLKPTALDVFDLPISVVHGYVGAIRAHLPWKSLGSSPVEASVSDLFIVVQPKKSLVWNNKVEEDRAKSMKKKKLENYEVVKALKDTTEEVTDPKDAGFVSRLTETVVNNLQVRIKNVHIRYEDFTNKDKPILFGVSMGGLEAKSTNASWQETFIKATKEALYKIVQLSKLSLYMNHSDKYNFTKTSSADFRQTYNSYTQEVVRNSYILEPINSTLKITLQRAGAVDINKPQVFGDLSFDDLSISLDDLQYQNILGVLDYVSNFAKFEMFRRLRPTVGLDTVENRRRWWLFAVKSISKSFEGRTFTWGQVEKRRRYREEYIKLYKRNKNVPWLPKLEEFDIMRKEKLEDELDPETIIIFRELAETEIKMERVTHKVKEEAQPKKGWFGGWFGGSGVDASGSEVKNNKELTISEEQKQKLREEIGYETNEAIEALKLPAEYKKYEFRLHLKKGAINLLSMKNKRASIIKAKYSDLVTEVGVREKGVQVRITLNSFIIKDKMSAATEYRKILSQGHIKSNAALAEKDEDHFVALEIETEPLDQRSDLRIDLKMKRTTNIVVNVPLVQHILAFFTIPSTINLKVLEEVARKQIQSSVQQAASQLRLALEEKKVFDIKVEIVAPTFIIPEDFTRIGDILMLDLGRFQLRSDIDKEQRSKRIKSQSIAEDDYYDKFKLDISNIRVIHTNHHELVSEHSTFDDGQILENMKIGLELDQCISQNTVKYANTRINLTIPRVKFNVSPGKVNLLIKVMNNVMELVDNPTGIESKQLKMKGSLIMLNSDQQQQQQSEYYAELRDGGNLLLYASHHQRRQPLINVNVVRNGAAVSDVADRQDQFQITLQRTNNQPSQVLTFQCDSALGKRNWCESFREAVVINQQYEMVAPKMTASDQQQQQSQAVDAADHNSTGLSDKQVTLLAKFSLQEFCVELIRTRSQSNQQVPLGQVSLQNFSGQCKVRTYDVQLDARLQSFTVTDLTVKDKRKDLLTSTSTNTTGDGVQKNLAEFQFIQVKNQNSDLYDLNADMKVGIILHKLHFFFEPIFLATVVKFIFDLRDIFDKLSTRTKYYVSERADDVIVPTATATTATTNNKNHRDQIALSVILQKVDLMLFDNGTMFAKFAMGGTQVDMNIKATNMIVHGTISDIKAQQMSDEELYREILDLGHAGKSLIDFTFESGRDDLIYDKRFCAKLESVKFVFLQRTISKLQVYFTSGVLMQAITEGSKKAAASAVEAVKKQTTSSTSLLLLDVVLVNPIIIVPVSHLSGDYVIADLGEIKISNHTQSIDNGVGHGGGLVETYGIMMTNMNMKTLMGHSRDQQQRGGEDNGLGSEGDQDGEVRCQGSAQRAGCTGAIGRAQRENEFDPRSISNDLSNIGSQPGSRQATTGQIHS
ncbi:vacuolar protein sorting protein VPS13 [Acrasis kona]|uniref:Vacuolar protein sorting protein VPS13 n=1 Tax=Acrasis kona TaxID=1008807 RepID=A0AAW2YIM6_9EUKA